MLRIIIYILISFSTLTCSAQDNLFKILTEATRPSIHNIYIDLEDDNNNRSSVPVAIIKGKKEGPIFTITAGVHGFEYPPIIAAQELIKEIDPEILTGTLIIIPLANPNSFYGRTPFLNPQDGLNLNRVFPGKSSGTITEKTASLITKIISKTEIFLDIHGGDANEDLLPFVCYYNNQSKSLQTQQAKTLSESSGFKHIVSFPYTLKDDKPAKYAFKQAVQDGKVALSIECGKLGNLQNDNVVLIKTGVYNMLNELNMYPFEKKSTTDFININKQVYIKSKYKGIYSSEFHSGDKVTKGDIIGLIKNEFGETLIEVKSPISGLVLYKIGTPPVNEGETLMCIGYNP